MALVSYGMSDASDSEEEEERQTPVQASAKIETKLSSNGETSKLLNGDIEDSDTTLFSVVPTPKNAPVLLDSEGLKKLLLNKPLSSAKQEKKVKITVPSLSEFEEDLPVPVVKKMTASAKGTGLFSLLPPPKNSGMSATLKLMPDSLKKTPKASDAKVAQAKNLKFVPDSVKKPPKTKPLPRPAVASAPVVEDDDSDDDSGGDFFSLNKPKEPEIVIDLPLEPVPDLASYTESAAEVETVQEDYPADDFIPVESDNLELDDEALAKLCGGNKRKRNAFQAQLIDVSGKDILPDQSEWLLKAMTEQQKTRSHKKSGGPSSQQKRKHQITYLAHQAKDQEEALQAQWANNRMSKKQTQSKYGF